MKITSFNLLPTFVADHTGKFHPGLIKDGIEIYFWPNVKMHTKEEALLRAREAINDALEAANSVIGEWNLETFS